MPCRVIQAAEVAESFVVDLKKQVAQKETAPLLVGFLANEDPAAKKYAEWTGRTCNDAGFKFELRECSRNELEDRLVEANRDPLVNGIMIYYPVFNGPQDQYLQNSVSVKKDVE
ncbi:NAD-dependent 5,10-methylenetetrahydrafolate dehydrogenase, partial [Blyttiomyces sp. JEL0837]